MPYLIIILFSIALVLSAVNAALFIWLKRRFDRKIALLIQMIDSAGNEITDMRHSVAEVEQNSTYHIRNLGASVNELKEKISRIEEDYRGLKETVFNDIASTRGEVYSLISNVSDLRIAINELKEKTSGLELDYQEAQKAANKVNDFGSALANIFDYDPIRAMQRSREKGDS